MSVKQSSAIYYLFSGRACKEFLEMWSVCVSPGCDGVVERMKQQNCSFLKENSSTKFYRSFVRFWVVRLSKLVFVSKQLHLNHCLLIKLHKRFGKVSCFNPGCLNGLFLLLLLLTRLSKIGIIVIYKTECDAERLGRTLQQKNWKFEKYIAEPLTGV